MTVIQNNPKFRAAVYIVAVVLQVAAIASRAVAPASGWAEAVEGVAAFVGAMAGITAVGNLAVPQAAQEPAKDENPSA